MTALFDGTCTDCLGYGEHFDWCPLLPGSASAPAASTGVHPARDAQGAASGDGPSGRSTAVSGISTRVRGHALINEGVGYSPGLTASTIIRRLHVLRHDRRGIAVCECEATSPPLESDRARKRWHREHKAEVFTCESCGQPASVTLTDGSFWCSSCDGSARRLGYPS